jgi:hypothetical protein
VWLAGVRSNGIFYVFWEHVKHFFIVNYTYRAVLFAVRFICCILSTNLLLVMYFLHSSELFYNCAIVAESCLQYIYVV